MKRNLKILGILIILSLFGGILTGQVLHRSVYGSNYTASIDMVIPYAGSDNNTTTSDTVKGIIMSGTYDQLVAKKVNQVSKKKVTASKIAKTISVEGVEGSQLITIGISSTDKKLTTEIGKTILSETGSVVKSAVGEQYTPRVLIDSKNLTVQTKNVSVVKISVLAGLIIFIVGSTLILLALAIRTYQQTEKSR